MCPQIHSTLLSLFSWDPNSSSCFVADIKPSFLSGIWISNLPMSSSVITFIPKCCCTAPSIQKSCDTERDQDPWVSGLDEKGCYLAEALSWCLNFLYPALCWEYIQLILTSNDRELTKCKGGSFHHPPSGQLAAWLTWKKVTQQQQKSFSWVSKLWVVVLKNNTAFLSTPLPNSELCGHKKVEIGHFLLE